MERLRFSILFVFLLLAVAACGANQDDPSATQAFEAAVETALAETQAAQPQPSATDTPPTAPLLVTNTPASLPATQTPRAITSPTATLYPTSSVPCYQAEFVSETIPDGTVMEPGETFRKTWEIKNTGTCEWTSFFRWVLVEGDSMLGPTNRSIPGGPYQPGDIMSITINLTAPLIQGTYRSVYKMQNTDGEFFTPNGFWFEIIVRKPTETP